jgi:hypothetical protein
MTLIGADSICQPQNATDGESRTLLVNASRLVNDALSLLTCSRTGSDGSWMFVPAGTVPSCCYADSS